MTATTAQHRPPDRTSPQAGRPGLHTDGQPGRGRAAYLSRYTVTVWDTFRLENVQTTAHNAPRRAARPPPGTHTTHGRHARQRTGQGEKGRNDMVQERTTEAASSTAERLAQCGLAVMTGTLQGRQDGRPYTWQHDRVLVLGVAKHGKQKAA